MLTFKSASVRITNTERAVAECLDIAFPDGLPNDCRAILVHSTMGHKLEKLGESFNKLAPGITMLGSSCSGTIGQEGVGESMNDIAMMAICGPPEECHFSTVHDIFGHNSYEKALELAQDLQKKAPNPVAIYLLCPGMDIANDLVLQALVDTFGEDIHIFGGTSSDNMRGIVNYQYDGTTTGEHNAWAVAFNDPTLKAVSRGTHGFSAYGTPLVATKTSGNKIIEFNGEPAWTAYTNKIGIPNSSLCGDTIPTGALAEKLPEHLATEYGNTHILRAITRYDADGTLHYATTCPEGLELWLTTRDEDLIFSEQERSLKCMVQEMNGGTPVAVFQTDCLARGRFLFNKVVKDEIIALMHSFLNDNSGGIPPWLGMYGFGEYAHLGGKNTFHNYSTALLALYR